MLWIKTLHILFVTSWFAGLFYLPRLYVNMAQPQDSGTQLVLQGMAQRLYRFMTPLAILAVAFGLMLWLHYGIGRGQLWMHLKLMGVLFLLAYHLTCGRILKTFAQGKNRRSHRYYRWFNEVPVILLFIVIALVVIKPFL
jgi:putative membrane protein